MALWNDFFDWLGLGGHSHDGGADSVAISHEPADNHVCVNPATNLPMLNGCGSLDAGGSPFGMDVHHHEETFSTYSSYSTDDWPTSSHWNDPFSSE